MQLLSAPPTLHGSHCPTELAWPWVTSYHPSSFTCGTQPGSYHQCVHSFLRLECSSSLAWRTLVQGQGNLFPPEGPVTVEPLFPSTCCRGWQTTAQG
jgi:hypothetical protein